MGILIEIPATVKNISTRVPITPTKSDKGVFEKSIEISSGKVRGCELGYARTEQFARQEIPIGSYSIKRFLEMADESYQMNARYAVRHIPSKTVMAVPYSHLRSYANGKYEVVITQLSR